jgi:hypothetical protein
MRLAAMMRLVVEEMRHQEPVGRRHLALRGAAEPGHVARQVGVIDSPRPVIRVLAERLSKEGSDAARLRAIIA